LREGLESLIAYADTGSRVRSLPIRPAIGAPRLLDCLGLSPLAPWHYLTYHKPYFFDIRPLLAMGRRPRYSNDEMLRESYDWFIAHYDRSMAQRAGSAHRRPVAEGVLALLKAFSRARRRGGQA
jgi:hypothetical protein